MITPLGPKDPSEIKPVTFDFTNQIGAATIASTTVAVTVIRGTDGNPGNLLSGGAAIAGPLVNQRIKAGISGCNYLITCLATDSAGLVHKIAASLRVQVPTT